MSIDLNTRRDELLALRVRLLTAAHDLVEGDQQQGELNSASGDQHLADHATDMVDRELDESLEENAVAIAAAIDAALARIDAGTYGSCTSCGEPIPEERLDAVPYATLCVACKRVEERRERAGL
ncbi:MAG: TraR/DksA family transcriptional regulator [Gaiella sp.]